MKFIRNRFLQLVVDGLVVALALAVGYLLRWPGELPPRDYVKQFLLVVPYLVMLRIALFAGFGVYKLVWRYISLRDIPKILWATGLGTALILGMRWTMPTLIQVLPFRLNAKFATVPFGVLIAEFILTFGGVVAVRSLWRVITERRRRLEGPLEGEEPAKRRVLLIGAGAPGVMMARQINENPRLGLEVIGFLDDDVNTHNTRIQGFDVLGGTDRLVELSRKHRAERLVLTMASFPRAFVRRILDLAKEAEVDVKIMPAFHELSPAILSKIRNVDIEDILGRAPVELEKDAISAFIQGKRVLVTGAGGSIGSEICRQVCRFHPAELLLLDQAENPLFVIHRELLQSDPGVPLQTLVGSVANRERMQQLMRAHRPDVVFHAAAHKHVPLMEGNPGEAIRNNVMGSRNMAELSAEVSADAFVMISTDKAVNPTSVMGATKRLAEMFVQALARHHSQTRFLTVRFGNVLGSQGSVVPIFKEQIARGGPVTVTHPDMKRYFMTIPEASQLVLQAAAMGEGGEIFILEMGEPVTIVSLARDLITLSGFIPDRDIRIEYTGMRPGEKLYEEINLTEEIASKTKHPRIWVGKSIPADLADVTAHVDDLVAQASVLDTMQLKARLSRHVPEYHPDLGTGRPRDLPTDAAAPPSPRASNPAAAETPPSSILH